MTLFTTCRLYLIPSKHTQWRITRKMIRMPLARRQILDSLWKREKSIQPYTKQTLWTRKPMEAETLLWGVITSACPSLIILCGHTLMGTAGSITWRLLCPNMIVLIFLSFCLYGTSSMSFVIPISKTGRLPKKDSEYQKCRIVKVKI